jgi:hypothetical protein
VQQARREEKEGKEKGEILKGRERGARRRPHRGRVDFHRRAPAAASRRGGARERWGEGGGGARCRPGPSQHPTLSGLC